MGRSSSLLLWCSLISSHHLRYKATHGLGGFVLLLTGGVGVGAECESGLVVSQHRGYRFHVHAVLQSQCGKGMPEIVEAYMRQSSVFQNFLMQVHNGIGVIHLPCDGRWEHVWIVGVFLVFGNQQVNSLLWNTDLSDRCLRFGARECQLPIGVLDVLLC